MKIENSASFAAHAINSHDELVEEVERLRGMIDALEAADALLAELERTDGN